MAKNLSLAKVKQVSKKLDQKQVHIIKSGDYIGEQLTFQPIFDDIKIEDLLTEFGTLLNQAKEKEIELSQNMQIYLLYMLTIKYFTHFYDDIPPILLSHGKTVGVLDTLEHFRKTGLLEECMNKMFLKEQVARVFSKATDVAAMGLLSQDLDKKMMEKLEQLRLQNSDMFKQLDNINVENPTQ